MLPINVKGWTKSEKCLATCQKKLGKLLKKMLKTSEIVKEISKKWLS